VTIIDGEEPMRFGLRPSCPTAWSPLLAGLTVSIALLLFAAQAHGAPRMDYGDAPDGADARYSIPVVAGFPSLLASSGPRHRGPGPSLGIRRDKEGDSKQVDRDRFDDGVSLDRIRRCKTSQVTVLVDTRRIPARLLRKRDLYLNAWFDWDRSGSWGEWNGCPTAKPLLNNEWSIVNQKFSGKSFLKQRVRAYTLKFKGGLHSGEFWFRTTLTLGQRLPIDAASRSGGATAKPFAYGETEDYLYRRSPNEPPPPEFEDESGEGKKGKGGEGEGKEPKGQGPFRVSCAPNPVAVGHGRARTVRFLIRDEGKGFIFGRRLSPREPGGNRVRVTRHSDQRGVPQGFFRGSGFHFQSRHRDARHDPIEIHVVRFSFVRGKFKQVLRCMVIVIHNKIVKPKKPHRPAAVPPAMKRVQGFGAYQQSSAFAQNYHVSVQFDQDAEGFRIKLKGGPPPTIVNAGSLSGGVNCEKAPDGQSVLCTGSLKAGTQAQLVVQFDPPPAPGELDGRLELYAIQGGVEKGPFPMQPAS
jgi:hypothetical protein